MHLYRIWGNVERTQNAFLHFHCNSGYLNMPHCDVYISCNATVILSSVVQSWWLCKPVRCLNFHLFCVWHGQFKHKAMRSVHILWNPKVHYHIYKYLPLSWENSVLREYYFCEIWGCHGNVTEDGYLSGCNAVQLARRVPAFQKPWFHHQHGRCVSQQSDLTCRYISTRLHSLHSK
jgi:hypothetical protein